MAYSTKPTLLIAISCVISVPLGFAQSPPLQASGYQLAFSEDFSNLDLSPNGSGTHKWYSGVYFEPTQSYSGPITVTNSVLNLPWRASSGEFNTSIEGCSFDASNCTTFRYGYFEARMKWDVTTGAWPAFWLITKQGIQGVQHVGEIDVFEGQGNDPNHFYGTVNEWNGGYDLVSSNSAGLKNQYLLLPGNDFSQWHTYGVLWVPGTLTWYYDDVAVGTWPTPAILDQQDFFMILTMQEGAAWTAGSLTGVTASTINLNVQWVHAFQVAATPQSEGVARLTPMLSVVPAIVTSGQAVSQGPLPDSQNLKLTLSLQSRNTAALNALLQSQSDPQSSSYHQFLSPSQFIDEFSPSQQDYDSVVVWAQSKGLIITGTSPNRSSVSVSGSVAIINQAIEIVLSSYRDTLTTKVFFTPDREPTLDLSVRLQGITGLATENLPLPRSIGMEKSAAGIPLHSTLERSSSFLRKEDRMQR